MKSTVTYTVTNDNGVELATFDTKDEALSYGCFVKACCGNRLIKNEMTTTHRFVGTGGRKSAKTQKNRRG